jgi:single-stranded DNA-binding protein
MANNEKETKTNETVSNNIFVRGFVCKEPVSKIGKSGKEYVNFSLGSTHTEFTKEGKKLEQTTYYNVNVFGQNLMRWVSLFQKGNRVAVQGTLQTSVVEKEGTNYTNRDLLTSNCNFDLNYGIPKSLTEGNSIVEQMFKNLELEKQAQAGKAEAPQQYATPEVEESQESTLEGSENFFDVGSAVESNEESLTMST